MIQRYDARNDLFEDEKEFKTKKRTVCQPSRIKFPCSFAMEKAAVVAACAFLFLANTATACGPFNDEIVENFDRES
jgi:hypothetical protein